VDGGAIFDASYGRDIWKYSASEAQAGCVMHMLVKVLVVSMLANADLGQPRQERAENNVQIGKLVIESNILPDADRVRLIHLFQEKTYAEDEIGERIRQALRDAGYFKAVVDEPKFSFPMQGEWRIADVTVKVQPGAQYRLGEIRFQQATVFPAAQLRNVFSQRNGDLFNATEFSEGLDDLRKLYGTRGYVNMVANPVPSIDESRHTIDLVLEVDEGQPFDFGKLYLEGVELHPGAGKALLDSWKPLEGRRYNPVELQNWLLANHFDWKVSALASDSIRTTEDSESRVVNVTLTQWPE
jgi:outer membrane translocation and assembly module TamA